MKLENKIDKPFSYLGNIQEISLQYLEKLPFEKALEFRNEMLNQFPNSRKYISEKAYEIILLQYNPNKKTFH